MHATTCAWFTLPIFAFVALPARADLSLSSEPTQNVSCSGGVCASTAKSANLNIDDLTSMLQAGDLTVETGGGAKTIQVLDGFSWTSGSRLSLVAKRSIGVRQPVTVGGAGGVDIVYGDGDLHFDSSGKIDFASTKATLTINGNSYLLAADTNTLAKNIKAHRAGFHALANDYDATHDVYDSTVVSGSFDGVFEGLGHTVSNMLLSSPGCNGGDLGFFRTVGAGAAVRDIALRYAQGISCGGRHAGLLVATNSGTVAGVMVEGTLRSSGPGNVGMTGGVVGGNFGGLVTRAASAVNVTDDNKGSSAGGGVVGWSDGIISLSHATGNVVGGTSALIGGVAGYAATVDRCYATGAVGVGNGKRNGRRATGVGGLLGSGSAVNSYATNGVRGGVGSVVGGLLGYGTNTSTSYATGNTSADRDSTVGGFVGHDGGAGDMSQDYWDLDTTGITDPNQGAGNIASDPGIAGLSDQELKAKLPKGFDPNIWGQSPAVNNGYPYLLDNPPE